MEIRDASSFLDECFGGTNTRISNRVETAEMMIAIGNTDMTLPIINNNYPGIR